MKLLSRTKDVFKLVRKAGDDRVTNNRLCNPGRTYQGLGDIEKACAKDYFKKAIETPHPPKAYTGATPAEEFRFSGDSRHLLIPWSGGAFAPLGPFLCPTTEEKKWPIAPKPGP